MRTKRITFENQNGLQLSARLELPLGFAPSHFAIFAHCFTCGKGIRAATMIARSLTLRGFAVLRFDFTGLGQSKGDFAETGFTTNIDDLLAAASFLEKNYQAPELLIGHSLGGTAAIHASAKIESIKAIATIGSPFEAAHVTKLFTDKTTDIRKHGRAEVSIGGRPFEIGKALLESLEAHSTASLLPDLRKALLIMHSPQDEIVEIKNAAEIYQAAHHPKSFVSLDGADHLLQNSDDAAYAAEVIAAWAARYLPQNPSSLLHTNEDVAVQLGSDGYTTEIVAGNHRLLADEPKEVGGHDMGPSPYQLLNAALGSCTAMTLHMYARRKEWPLEQVTVHLSHKRLHADDVAQAESGSGKVNNFERIIELKGHLSGAQREKLLEIANKCPVHKTLTDERVLVNTRLLD